MNNKKIFDYAILAEASYADFSGMVFEEEIIKNRIKNTDNGKKPKPESFAKLVVEKYQVIAHYKDRIDESSFSGLYSEEKYENVYMHHLHGTTCLSASPYPFHHKIFPHYTKLTHCAA